MRRSSCRFTFGRADARDGTLPVAAEVPDDAPEASEQTEAPKVSALEAKVKELMANKAFREMMDRAEEEARGKVRAMRPELYTDNVTPRQQYERSLPEMEDGAAALETRPDAGAADASVILESMTGAMRARPYPDSDVPEALTTHREAVEAEADRLYNGRTARPE